MYFMAAASKTDVTSGCISDLYPASVNRMDNIAQILRPDHNKDDYLVYVFHTVNVHVHLSSETMGQHWIKII